MSDEKALLAAISAHPLDDAPRLVYADWLDEQGGESQVARAEFIRVQCEMALLAAYDPRYQALEKREQELLGKWRGEWVKPLPKKLRGVDFSRGFPLPTIRRSSVTELVKLTPRALRHAPLWRYPFGNPDTLETLLAWPLLPRLTTLSLFSGGSNDLKRIAECDGLRNVTELAFTGCNMSANDLKLILDAWTGRRLLHLWVNSCPVGDEGIKLIATHPATAGLRLLRAHTADFTSEGTKAIADSPNLERVTLATFAHNLLREDGCRHILRWKALKGIRELYMMNTGMPQSVADEFRKFLGSRVTL